MASEKKAKEALGSYCGCNGPVCGPRRGKKSISAKEMRLATKNTSDDSDESTTDSDESMTDSDESTTL